MPALDREQIPHRSSSHPRQPSAHGRRGLGSPAWLLAAVGLEAASFGGYIWLLRVIATPLSWRDALRITLAGVAATRIVTVAGAGGIAVTIAGLRQSGLTTREAPERQAVDLVVLYTVFFGLMVLDGLVLAALGGRHPGLTVVPAFLGATIVGLAGAMVLVPGSFEHTLRRRRRLGRRFGAAAAVPGALALVSLRRMKPAAEDPAPRSLRALARTGANRRGG